MLDREEITRAAALRAAWDAEAKNPDVNLMPLTIEVIRARATMGEIVARLRSVFGTYTERPVF